MNGAEAHPFLLAFAVDLLSPVEESASPGRDEEWVCPTVVTHPSAGIAAVPEGVRRLGRQLKRCEKPRSSYDGRTTPFGGACGEGESSLESLESRIAFFFNVVAVDADGSCCHTAAEEDCTGAPCHEDQSAQETNSYCPACEALRLNEEVHQQYQRFVLDVCQSDLCAKCSLRTLAFALRLFQRYIAGYEEASLVELCRCYGIPDTDLPVLVLGECVSLASNYLGDGEPCAATVLTMHVQQVLHFDVLEVTPFDFWSLVVDSPLADPVTASKRDMLQGILRTFSTAVVVMLSLPTLATLPSSQMAAFAMLYSVMITADAPQTVLEWITHDMEMRGMHRQRETWGQVVSILTGST